jgi:hypothetical protein
MARRFLAWYRRFYLVLNLPVLFVITELVMMRIDIVRRVPNDLDVALGHLKSAPPGDAPVLVLLGNSATRSGIDEGQLERSLARSGHPMRVYNFGLAAARIDDTLEMTRRLLGMGVKPKLAVLGVNPFLIDDRVNSDSRFPWLRRTTPYLYFHRSRLRGMLKKLLRSSMDNPQDFGLAGTNAVQTGAQREFGAEAFVREFGNRPIDDFPRLDQVPEFLDWLESHGIATCVVVLPLSPDGKARLSNYPELIAALKDKLAPTSLDLVDAYPYTSFADVGHVNAAGRKQMTDDLATWLQTKPEVTSR